MNREKFMAMHPLMRQELSPASGPNDKREAIVALSR